jgi:hypothetical protein
VNIERNVLIFDTGPLRELILYEAVHTLGFKRLAPDLLHLRSVTDRDRLSQFISGFQNRTTTPQVVAELSSWVFRTDSQGRANIWAVVYREFQGMGMDERLIKLLEMPRDIVAELGAVDTSLLKLGLSFDSGVPLVLSVDGSLIAKCKQSGVNAFHLWEVIAGPTS